jgi:hypothetical protein
MTRILLKRKNKRLGAGMRCTPVIPELRIQGQEDCKFKASLGYIAKQKRERVGEREIEDGLWFSLGGWGKWQYRGLNAQPHLLEALSHLSHTPGPARGFLLGLFTWRKQKL